MTVFLVYISLILIIISIGLLVRISLITKNLNKKRTVEEIHKENAFTRKVILVVLIIFMISLIWNYYQYRP